MSTYEDMATVDLLALREALHRLSQPLSSLVLLLELAGEDASELGRENTIREAQEQCERTLQAFEHLRALLRAAQPA